jgi:hypothetical protein
MISKSMIDIVFYGLVFVGYLAIIDCHVRNKFHIVRCYIFIATIYLMFAAAKLYAFVNGGAN